MACIRGHPAHEIAGCVGESASKSEELLFYRPGIKIDCQRRKILPRFPLRRRLNRLKLFFRTRPPGTHRARSSFGLRMERLRIACRNNCAHRSGYLEKVATVCFWHQFLLESHGLRVFAELLRRSPRRYRSLRLRLSIWLIKPADGDNFLSAFPPW